MLFREKSLREKGQRTKMMNGKNKQLGHGREIGQFGR
jgi:hypothetical protein